MTKRDLRTAQYIAAKWDTRKITFNSLKNKEAELLFAFWSGELQKRIDTAEQEILEDIFLAAKDFDSAEYLAYLWDTRVITFNTLTHREAELLFAFWSGDLRKRIYDTEQAVHRELHIARRELLNAQLLNAKWNTRQITFDALTYKQAELLFALWSGKQQKRIDDLSSALLYVEPGVIWITVMSMSGRKLKTIIAEYTAKIENVKKTIAEALEGHWQSYELVYGAHKLQNMKTLAECGIRHDVSVSLIVNNSECKIT